MRWFEAHYLEGVTPHWYMWVFVNFIPNPLRTKSLYCKDLQDLTWLQQRGYPCLLKFGKN
nr:hypothetical protein GZ27A8_27 [uncultured archaeon GZfos27A8]